MELLPDDLVAGILRRLAPRDQAMARGVCKAWRAVIDGRRLLRSDLLPLTLGGIFINFHAQSFSEYFFPAITSTPTISSMADYVPFSSKTDDRYVTGHCNGLLLLEGDYVVNPATRRWAQVPPPASHRPLDFGCTFLVFDPALSSHYDLFSVRQLIYRTDRVGGVVTEAGSQEWPPSSCIIHVFSSSSSKASGGWEDRLFVRDGEAAAMITDARTRMVKEDPAVYYKRASYIPCETNIVLRVSLSDSKYRAIKPPSAIGVKEVLHLGKSKDGVYFASLSGRNNGVERLQIWVLSESCGQTEWLFKYRADISWALRDNLESWVLQDVNYNYKYGHLANDRNEKRHVLAYGSFLILGFHPFEEVVFLSQALRWGLAYDLTSSKLQCLGYLYPTEYNQFSEGEYILQAYPYTPCWMDVTTNA